MIVTSLQFMTGIMVARSAEDVAVTIVNDEATPLSATLTGELGADNPGLTPDGPFASTDLSIVIDNLAPGQSRTVVGRWNVSDEDSVAQPQYAPDGSYIIVPPEAKKVLRLSVNGAVVVAAKNIHVWGFGVDRTQTVITEGTTVSGDIDVKRVNLENHPVPDAADCRLFGLDGGRYNSTLHVDEYPNAAGVYIPATDENKQLLLSMRRNLLARDASGNQPASITFPPMAAKSTQTKKIKRLPVGAYPDLRKGILLLSVLANTPGNILVPEGTTIRTKVV